MSSQCGRGTIRQAPTIWYVGGEDLRFRIPLLKAVEECGFSVGAVGSEPSDPFNAEGISYWRYSLNRWINPLDDLRSASEIHNLLLKFKPDIIHAFDTKPGLIAPWAGRSTGVRACLRTITGVGYVFSSLSPIALSLRPVYMALQKFISRYCAMTIFQNQADQEFFLRNGLAESDKSALVPSSGIDVEGFLNRRPARDDVAKLRQELGLERKTVITMVSRIVKQKGVLEYLESATEVSKRVSDVSFLLVGPQSSEGRQAISIKTLQKKARDVIYLGFRDDIPALLSLTDIFVFPSYYREGVPRVLLEAGVMGIPLITTDMPGCRDVVTHGKNGLLVPPRDTNALIGAILELLGSREKRSLMGKLGASFIREKFSVQRVAKEYVTIYNSLLNHNRAM